MLWDGNRQAQEYTDTHVFTTVYDQDSFEPVARLVWLKPNLLEASNDEQYSDKPNNPIQIYHYHNDHLGTPNELTNNQGEVVWLADYEAWGNTAKVVYTPIELQQIQIAKDELQPIRFQGQTIDQETGLHYNRFRYYDPDVGMFISRDPIELDGGFNIFQYAPNPVMWIDPFGLANVSNAPALAANMAKEGRTLLPGQTANHIVQDHRINEYTKKSREILKRAGIDHHTHAANGSALWGTGKNQVLQPGHPGRGGPTYDNYNFHNKHSDQRIMKLLERAEKSGKPGAVERMLRAIGKKQEAGRWITPRDAKGRYAKPKC